MGFETQIVTLEEEIAHRVNLPRWGLKLFLVSAKTTHKLGCKFTPLGFETPPASHRRRAASFGVNLPRWGLKRIFQLVKVCALI